MSNMNNFSPIRQVLYALDAILGAIYILNEDLGLFAQEPGHRTASEVKCDSAMLEAVEWYKSALDAIGWNVGEMETFGDTIAYDVLGRARTLIDEVQPTGVEAFYLSALVFIADDCCAIWDTLGRSCADTPLPTLRIALTESLLQDYGLNVTAPGAAWKTVLSAASDLASRWQSWAREPLH
jgi:hypothetical protein